MRANWLYIVLFIGCIHCAYSQNRDSIIVQKNLHLGKFYLIQHRYFEAEAALKKVIRIDPSQTVAYQQLSEVYVFLEKPDSVVHFLTLAFQTDIRLYSNGFAGLGDDYLRFGFNHLAAGAYDKQIDLLKYRKEECSVLKRKRDSLYDEDRFTPVFKDVFQYDLVFVDTSSELSRHHKRIIDNRIAECNATGVILRSYHSKDLKAFDALRVTKNRSKRIKEYIKQRYPALKVLMFNYGRGKEFLPNTCERSKAFNRRVRMECI